MGPQRLGFYQSWWWRRRQRLCSYRVRGLWQLGSACRTWSRLGLGLREPVRRVRLRSEEHVLISALLWLGETESMDSKSKCDFWLCAFWGIHFVFLWNIVFFPPPLLVPMFRCSENVEKKWEFGFWLEFEKTY